MLTAARAVGDMGGGLVAVAGEEMLASVPLPIAGLMSDRPVEVVREQMDRLVESARSLGSSLHDPLMALSFLALCGMRFGHSRRRKRSRRAQPK